MQQTMTETEILTEQDALTDLLNQEKNNISGFATSITESSCENLRQVLQNAFTTTWQDQYQIFHTMEQKGLYKTKDAQQSDIQTAVTKLSNMQSQLN